MPALLGQFPMDDDFLDQIGGLLAEMEASMNRLEQKPDDAEALEQAYRHTHTISISAAMVDFPSLSQVAHGMEDVFGDALDEVLRLDAAAISLLRRSLGRVRLMAALLKAGAGEDERILAEDKADHENFRQRHEGGRF